MCSSDLLAFNVTETGMSYHYSNGESPVVHKSEQISPGFKDHYVIDKQKLFLAALFHDIGKIYDYELIIREPKFWRKSLHARQTHHISRSALIWNEAKNKLNFQDDDDEVLHAILSHHGRREYGSPVSPATRIAWLLHLCDSISARMFDCYTKDY